MSLEREFIEFLIGADVLRFGDFTTKSGRQTPYFLDMGRIERGAQLAQLGAFYGRSAQAAFGTGFDVLFGPAYKGIPLVCATAGWLAREAQRDVGFCFNRKEVKDHGEGGVLVGRRLRDGDRVLILEDVTTAGTSIRETVPILTAAADVKLAGLLVAVDRRERGRGEGSALAELAEEFAMPCRSIISIDDVLLSVEDQALRGRIEAYLERYGATSPRA